MPFQLQKAFFRDARAEQAIELRQRVALALSRVLVASGRDLNFICGMASCQQPLHDLAFGNYEDFLTRVTLSPVIGDHLNMANKDKPIRKSIRTRITRELMKLFSIDE